jgi:hypothetical protein
MIYQLEAGKHLLKLHCRDRRDVMEMLGRMKASWAGRWHFQLEFGQDGNTASALTDEVRALITEILVSPQIGGAPTSEMERVVQTVKQHMRQYGAHPVMGLRTERNKGRIRNYLSSVLGDPNLTMEAALQIADAVE